MAWHDPYRIRTWQELVSWINEIGFLPLFANEISGFSVEEHVSPKYWWSGARRRIDHRTGLNQKAPRPWTTVRKRGAFLFTFLAVGVRVSSVSGQPH